MEEEIRKLREQRKNDGGFGDHPDEVYDEFNKEGYLETAQDNNDEDNQNHHNLESYTGGNVGLQWGEIGGEETEPSISSSTRITDRESEVNILSLQVLLLLPKLPESFNFHCFRDLILSFNLKSAPDPFIV